MQQHYMQDLAQISLPVNQTMQPSSASTVAEHPFNVPSSSSHSVQEASMQREAQESIQAPSNMISLPSLNMPIASYVLSSGNTISSSVTVYDSKLCLKHGACRKV